MTTRLNTKKTVPRWETCHKNDLSTLLLCDDLSGEDQDKYLSTKNLELQRMAGYILIDLEITDPEGFKVAKNRAIVVQGL